MRNKICHSLQTATLTLLDDRDEEYVICALLHDIGDTLGTFNHPDIAAAILKRFISEANLWMIQHHGIFQGYNFFHHIGLNRNLRDMFKGHPYTIRRLSLLSSTTTALSTLLVRYFHSPLLNQYCDDSWPHRGIRYTRRTLTQRRRFDSQLGFFKVF